MAKIILSLLLCISFQLKAAELKIEPVYGVERSYQRSPEPARYKTETFFGVRGTYGTELLAGELELNQSNNSYDVADTKSETQTQKVLIGARLIPFQAKYYSLFLRGGFRMQKVKRELTTSTGTKTDNEAINFDPYAGTGLSLNLAGIVSLNTSATLVFNKDAASSEQYDTRYTFSVSFKYGSSGP